MSEERKLEIIIITGLSGAGKTNAIDWFEDRGYYCIDNMPPALISNFLNLSYTSTEPIYKIAFGIDIRGEAFFTNLKNTLLELKKNQQIDCKILFIEASDNTLVKRFNETRRAHPMSMGPASKKIVQKEREALKDIRDISDFVMNTSNLKVPAFKHALSRIFDEGAGKQDFTVNIQSFGFKNGLPQETDMVFDMRFIPNPYYVKSLRALTGRNDKVYRYVMRQDITKKFIEDLTPLLEDIIPKYMEEGKFHLNLSFGCTGGKHRSVSMARKMAEVMEGKGYTVTLEHRDIL